MYNIQTRIHSLASKRLPCMTGIFLPLKEQCESPKKRVISSCGAISIYDMLNLLICKRGFPFVIKAKVGGGKYYMYAKRLL